MRVLSSPYMFPPGISDKILQYALKPQSPGAANQISDLADVFLPWLVRLFSSLIAENARCIGAMARIALDPAQPHRA